MKNLRLFSLLIAGLALNVHAQKVDKTNVTYKSYHVPTVPVKDVKSVNFKIYSVYDGLNSGNLKVKKLEQAQENANERTLYFMNDLEIVQESGDLTIEVAFGQIVYNKKTIKEWKAPCARDDGNLTADDIKECPAFYYSIDYTLPAAFQVKNKNGEVVYGDVFEQNHTTTYGKTDLNAFLSKDKLIKDYDENNREKNVTHKIHSDRIEAFFETVDDMLYFEKDKHEFSFGSGKGKSHDYTELTATMGKAVAVFDTDKPDFSQLDACIAVWEKEVGNADTGNKDARINKKITRELYQNLAIAYMYQNKYPEAIKYASKFRNLSMSDNGELTARIYRKYFGYKANADLEIPAKMEKAKDFKTLVSAVRKDVNLFYYEDKSAEIIENATKFQAELEQDQQEEKEEITETAMEGENPYSAQVTSNPTQGNMLMLNGFTHADIMGKEMPKEIAALKELNYLRAFNMKFTALPDNIGNLVNLKTLDLGGCSLTALPTSIGDLKNLQTLNLTNNPIDKLPAEIMQCTNLKTLKLKGTNVSDDQVSEIQKALPKCKIKK
jgi:hypothetical protein